MRRFSRTIFLAAAASSATLAYSASSGEAPADAVITGAKIYTVDPAHSVAEALAVRGDRIVFVGSSADARRFAGPSTHVEDAHGRLVLPGLIDAHIHPLDTVDLDVCDLDSRAVSLQELKDFVSACLERYPPPQGQRLIVHQWNYTTGNQPDAQFPSLRAALDAASTTVQIQLLGNDGHHGAFNSLGLANARNLKGRIVGLSKETLAHELAAYKDFVGVDSHGEPNGAVNEDARYLINPHSMMYVDIDKLATEPERMPQHMNSSGITGIMDAMASPDGLFIYDKLLQTGKLTLRVRLAQFYDPSNTRTPAGKVDYDGMVKQAMAVRAKYARNPLLHADYIKVFADGVLEGNPFAMPPTLPNGAVLKPYLQPIFTVDASGSASVKGYVDPQSTPCKDYRAHPNRYQRSSDVDAFLKTNGFHPAQCAISSGRLQHEREIILEYVRRMHAAGFNVHIHVIGDRALRTALDAIEAARASDGNSKTRDSLAHMQLADPADVRRVGQDHLYVAFTYDWAETSPDYDLTVIPFLEKVQGNTYQTLHPPGSFYDAHAYPARAVKEAGGILAAGSDAPVGSRDPQPFANMSRAVTRATRNDPPLNPDQRLTIQDAIDAYTINNARMLQMDADAGSIEVGKSADFIVVDQDILALAEAGRAQDIAKTRVLATWFRGKNVYRRAATTAAQKSESSMMARPSGLERAPHPTTTTFSRGFR